MNIEAEIKLGEILLNTEKNKGVVLDGKDKNNLSVITIDDSRCTLSELGISLNLSSEAQALAKLLTKNLNDYQRSCLVLELEDYYKKKAKKRQGTRTDIQPILAESSKSDVRDQLAKKAGVSHGTIDKVKTIEKEAEISRLYIYITLALSLMQVANCLISPTIAPDKQFCPICPFRSFRTVFKTSHQMIKNFIGTIAISKNKFEIC